MSGRNGNATEEATAGVPHTLEQHVLYDKSITKQQVACDCMFYLISMLQSKRYRYLDMSSGKWMVLEELFNTLNPLEVALDAGVD